MQLSDIITYLAEFTGYAATLGTVILRLGEVRRPFWILAALFGAEVLGGLLHKKNRVVRLLPFLLAALPLFRESSPIAALYAAPMLILAAVRVYTGRYSADRETFCSVFKYVCVFYLLFFLSALTEKDPAGFAVKTAPYFTVFLSAGILSMRLLRDENLSGLGPKYHILTSLPVFFAIVLGFFFSSETGFTMLKAAANAIYSYVFVPVLLLVIAVLMIVPALLFWLIGKLISLIPVGEGEEPVIDMDFNFFGEEALEEQTLRTMPDVIKKALIGIAVLFFLFLCFLLARRMIRKRMAAAASSDGAGRMPLTVPEKTHKSLFPASERETIRLCYRRYLGLIGRLGIPVEGELLSDELEKQSLPYTGPSASTLRALWIKAKYGQDDCSREEAAEARHSLREIRKALRKNEQKAD